MGNVLRVLGRDIVRLVKAPAALVVVMALLVLPSVYTWYNVVGFWNPYDNTSQLRVDVVNEDAGGSSELTGQVRVGDMIVEKLRENDQLDWAFVDRDTAMAELESGASYAVFVIPEDFTANLLTLTTGDFTQPNLLYYVNEKLGPVAPKITDTGATTLDETINSAFVSTVTDAAVEALDAAAGESRAAVDESRAQALGKLGEAVSVIGGARETLAGVSGATDAALARAEDARGVLADVRAEMDLAATALARMSAQAAQMQDALSGFSADALPAVGEGLAAMSSLSAQASKAMGDMTSSAEGASASVGVALAQANAVVGEGEALARHVRALADALPDDGKDAEGKAALTSLADRLDEDNARARALVADLEALSADAEGASQAVADAAASFDAAVQDAVASADAYANALFTSTIPQVSAGLSRLAAATASLEGALSGERVVTDQIGLVLGQLTSTLESAREAVGATDGLLGDLEAGLGLVRTDVTALGSADALSEILGEDGLDAGKIASFMGAPTEVETVQLYPLNAYGSAMAPLFMNLTFWIGAFMLLVIMRQEVDSEGIRNFTLAQRYLSRFALFAVLAMLQAVICCAGVLALGVQAESPPALFLAAAVASLAYLSIIYALSVTLQHIGKGICIVLVFAQIPGATGLYPVEMTSAFFQAVYPLLPFTYGIGAMRESICGFYGGQYAHDVGMLLLYFAAFMALGLVFRPLLANVNHMVARQVRQSGIFNGEDVEVPVRPYRFSQLVRALSDKEEYRREITRRYASFMRWYPRLTRGSVAAGVAIPVTLMLVFALTPTEKVVLLTACLVSLAALLVFLVVVESMRYSFERQMSLEDMSEESLLGLYSSRNRMQRPGEEADADAAGVVRDASADAASVVQAAPADAAAEPGEGAGADAAGAKGGEGRA
ncbi:YhgE/Pip domain-containing protein [Adlercreutzia sp. ZJ473]|uniref:YhgE/Pip domain-containing protein n=1 Tax=Adlercreutzia sp. ZJ473 TaxID=2722822 RepID=UPI0015533C2B|nr:YhgE/Pip domain-containing protein [Adlercreutzia sp. ZJ473]